MVTAPLVDMGLTPQAAARQIVEQVRALGREPAELTAGDRMQLLSVLDLALQAPRLANYVIDALIDAYAELSAEFGAAVGRHRTDAVWSRPYPIGVQEYSPIFGDNPMLHLGLLGAMQQSPWPRNRLQALHAVVSTGAEIAEALQGLLDDFATVEREAATIVQRLHTIRDIRARSAMHVVQIEAYLTATLLEGDLAGHNCLDLGAGQGELVRHLQQEGAWAMGTEVDLPGEGLFNIALEPKFDVVFATGFLEPGAFQWPKIGLNVMAYSERVDELVASAAALVKPGGLLIVRNVNFPLQFSRKALQQARLVHQRVLVPFCTPSFGGRAAAWRKT